MSAKDLLEGLDLDDIDAKKAVSPLIQLYEELAGAADGDLQDYPDFVNEEDAIIQQEMAAQNSDDSNVDFDNISDDDSSPNGWVKWFCSLEGHDFLVEVEEDFLKDLFNLHVGLKNKFKPDRFK